MATDFSKMLADYVDFSRELGELLQFALATQSSCHKVFSSQLPSPPAVEKMHRWLSSMPIAFGKWIDSTEHRDNCQAVLLQPLEERLASLSLACFKQVGELVSKCVSGAENLESTVASLTESKLKLPSDDDVSKVLGCMIEVPDFFRS